jgi:hypothetical protein
MPPTFTLYGTMNKLLALIACAAFLTGCDFIGSDADPVAFSGLTVTSAPLRADEDGSGPDLYVEIQDAGGRAVYEAPSIVEDADETVFPYTVSEAGQLVGTSRAYFVVVMDRDPDGFDLLAASGPFSADDLRASTEATFAVPDASGSVEAEINLSR